MITSPTVAGQIGNTVKRLHVLHRQRRVIGLRQSGMTRDEISKQLGVSLRTVFRDLEECAGDVEVIDELIQDSCVTAEDAHLKLSKMFDSRIQELFDDEWKILPKSQWPEPFKSWGLLTEIKVEDVMVQDADGDGSTWKKSGGKRVTVKGPDVHKTIELAMKHKAVDAMAAQKTNVDLQVTVSADRARQVAADRKRLARASKVIEASATPIEPQSDDQ